MSKVRLAIIGNGMVGHCFIEDLLDKSDVANFDITVFCEELCIAYDCVHLLSYFSHHTAEELLLVREGFYEKHGIKVLVGECAITINCQEKVIHSSAGCTVFYDKLIMATGSYLWILSIKGSDTQDCFVYCTIEDLNAIESCACCSKRGAVVGGGLLGLEAAGVLKNLGIETHVIEFAPMLMAEQLDQMGGEQLCCKIESMGVRVHTSKNTLEIVQEGVEACKTMCFADGSELEVDFIVFSTGICLCDKLATQCGLDVALCGGIVINDSCQTSDLDIYAIGECASWNNCVFGLVAPGYKMVQVAVDHILGSENAFEGADLSAKLKLLGVDVGGIGDAHGCMPGACSYVYLDESKEIYKCLIVSEDNKTLLGVVLVGDTSDYGNLLQLVLNAIELLENLDSLILPAHLGSGKLSIGVDKLLDSVQICSCFDVTKGDLIAAINKGCHTVVALKAETKVGTGCGGCILLVTQVLNVELVKQGIEVNNNLCEHFAYSCQELFHLICVEGIKTFEELLVKHGKGYGCEVCKPTVGLLLASCWNEYILKLEHTLLQDSNDNFLANIQKDGTYLVILCSLGGEITLEGLMVVGCIVCEFNLYTKITGSQCLVMFGAQKDDLLEIWCQLIEAGFETGHAYVKALCMVKTCVGSTWCCYGVGDSVGLGVELENCYKGICMLYKMKFGVSGCTCECSEAQGKDVGIIATEKGWNLYVCGNGGMKLCHVDLLVVDIDCEMLIKYLDCFMMFYICTADKLTCTALWLENLEGGIDYLKAVIIDDKLGLNAHLEEEMACLCEVVLCEWTEMVNMLSVQTCFKHFINSDKCDLNVQMVPEREQHCLAMLYECIPVTLVEDNA